MKCMISQPMNGLTDEEILAIRDEITKEIEELGYEVVSGFTDESNMSEEELDKINSVKYPRIARLSRSIEKLADCDAAYFAFGWEKANGCRVEHEICQLYGIKCIYQMLPAFER